MRLRRVLISVLLVGAALAGCSLGADFAGLSGTDLPDSGSSNDGDGPADTSTSDTFVSADSGDAGLGDADAARCGDAWAPPAMIASAGFCIDSTEVTQKDYNDFRITNAGNFGGQPTECAWNVSWDPAGACSFDPTSTLPMSGVDWCDAHAYCKWAGKRLCGRIGGGSEDPQNNGANASNMWFAACSNFGQNAFPYGNVYDAKKCNGGDYDDAAANNLPVASVGCVGSLPGLHDMSGNIEEWTDGCLPDNDGGGVQFDDCPRRGGDRGEDVLSLRCVGNNRANRDLRQCYVGFRCCADLGQ